MTNPNDETRAKILQYFYSRNAQATSRFGKKGSAIKISDVKRELKALHGLTQQQVMSNLTYLIDRDWVNTVDQKKEVNTKGGTKVPSVVTFYEISAAGIEKIEGESEFTPPDRYPGVNINATGSNIITLGDGNYVNAEYKGLHQELDTLKTAILNSDLSQEEKFETAVDIESMKDQLAKKAPDSGVLGGLWPKVQKVAMLAGLGSSAAAIGSEILKLVH